MICITRISLQPMSWLNGGDSKVSYNLGDLTRVALLVDLDRVIVGEVKEGSEAAGLSKASMTGHKCLDKCAWSQLRDGSGKDGRLYFTGNRIRKQRGFKAADPDLNMWCICPTLPWMKS